MPQTAAQAADAEYRRELRATKRAAREANPLELKCAGCGRLFETTDPRRRYHSDACKQKAFRLRQGRTVTDG